MRLFFNPKIDFKIVSHMKSDMTQTYKELKEIEKVLKSSIWTAGEIVFKNKLSSEELEIITDVTLRNGLDLGVLIHVLAALDQYISDLLENSFHKQYSDVTNVESALIKTLIFDQESQEQIHQSVYGLIHFVFFGLTDTLEFGKKVTDDNMGEFDTYEDDKEKRLSILNEIAADAKVFLESLRNHIGSLSEIQKMMLSSGLEATLLMISFLGVHITKEIIMRESLGIPSIDSFLSVFYTANKMIIADEINHTNFSCILIRESNYTQNDEEKVVSILDKVNKDFIKILTVSEDTEQMFLKFYQDFKQAWLVRIHGEKSITSQQLLKDTSLGGIIGVTYDNFFANNPLYKKNSAIDYNLNILTDEI